ncbi:hypothetical protein VFPBJ_09371 [Purpureocillium lilacinum]|uniref:Uncharacterized protein n=1 Tax=Purpureocillium lilacinum TaxID=33203 RepID=A0A179GCY9_PURLI|nr:hypothetical protein VFPBJ_09371 [Purpureocillium lilacinum]
MLGCLRGRVRACARRPAICSLLAVLALRLRVLHLALRRANVFTALVVRVNVLAASSDSWPSAAGVSCLGAASPEFLA